MKTVVAVAGALVLSLLGNAWQWRAAAQAAARVRGEIATAAAQAQADAGTDALAKIGALERQRRSDDAQLERLRQQLADAAEQQIVVYRDRIKTVEVPVCRASTEQIAALNALLEER